MAYRTHQIDGYEITYTPSRRAYRVTGPGIVTADYYPADKFSPSSIAYALGVAHDSEDAVRSEAELDRCAGGAL